MLSNKRIGMWCWALTGEEAVLALNVGEAIKAGLFVPPDQALRYDAMLAKQRKLTARARRTPPRDIVWRT